jgi:DNA-binding response OmpR family regulator
MDTHLNIILVEDHRALRKVTAGVLREEGHQVIALTCAEDLEDLAGAQAADLFIIDLNLPGEDGLSLAQRLRAVHPQVGIIMLTGRDQPQDMVAGYRNGADLYLVKPVDPQTLMAAIESLMRRLKPEVSPSMDPQHLTWLDIAELRLCGPTGDVLLTAIEVRLLTGLARAPGHRLAQFHLAELTGQLDEAYNKRVLEVRIARLRKKLIEVGASPNCIKALRNEGYQLCTLIQIR